MKLRMLQTVSVAVLLVVLGGCMPAPPHLAVAPGVVASDWGAPTAPAAAPDVGEPSGPGQFWHRFGSAQLEQLIAEGLAGNASLDAVRARVTEARALGHEARAARLPTASLSTGATRTGTNVAAATAFSYNTGSAELEVAYDLDLFGGAKASARAAADRARASAFDRAAATLVVETEIARTYVTLSATQQRQSLNRELLGDARELQRIITLRHHEGEAGTVDINRQLLEVRKLEAEALQLDQARRAGLTALAVLLGREAPHFTLDAEDIAALRVPMLAAGQPGDLVLRRPDLRAAEARISAADGDVRAARAAFLPGLSLSASGLGQVLLAGGPLGWTSTIGAGLLTPIFAGGKLDAKFDHATAAQKESIALYRQSLLEALREGCDALAAIEVSAGRLAVLGQAVDEAGETTRLARLQYREGEADLTTMIDARRNEAALRQALIDARQDRLLAEIDLYKALGGAPF